jgi:hypothetical protein
MDEYGRAGTTGMTGDLHGEPEGGLPPEAAPVLATSAAAAIGAKARQHPWTLMSLVLVVLTLGVALLLRRRGSSTAHALLDPEIPPMR